MLVAQAHKDSLPVVYSTGVKIIRLMTRMLIRPILAPVVTLGESNDQLPVIIVSIQCLIIYTQGLYLTGGYQTTTHIIYQPF